jgi:hypothetical protein
MMKKYVRVNIVDAEPMTRGEYNRFRGWTIPADENPNNEGYIIWYRKGKEDEYVSWCPKKDFDEVSREVEGLSFGMAIEAMKQGRKVARKGWNGKSQYLTLVTEFTYVDCKGKHDAVHQTSGRAAIIFHGTFGEQVGWLASQADMLSDDWMIV